MVSPITTTIEICNLALDLLGSKATITSLTDGSEEAAACSRHLQLAVIASLDIVNWPFAKRFNVIFPAAGSEGTPVEPFEPWGFVYEIPQDCVAPRALYPGARSVNEASKIAFDFLTVPDPDDVTKTLQVIATDEEGDDSTRPLLEYTVMLSGPQAFPVPYIDLLAATLALRLAAPLTADPNRVAFVKQVYQQALNAAVASAMSQRREDVEADGAFLSARN